MSEWKRYKLGELLSIKHGWAFKSENYVKDGKTALVTLRNISEDSRFVFDVNKTTYYGGEYPEEYNLNEGDLIIPLTEQVVGLLGNSAFVPNFSDIKFVLNQRVGKVQEKYEKIDKIFLKYLLSTTTVRTQMEYRASGTKQRNISPKDIYDIEVYIPELVIQKYIGRILYNLDKKIQINNQINQELEAMAKTLYDYWFVQFDFPDQNGNPYKSSGGKMVYHPELKREIPEGWGMEKLKYFLTIKNGKDHKHLQDGKFAVYGSGGIMRTVADYLYSGESILFPRKGTLDNVMYVNEEFWTVDTMFYSEVNKNNSALYVFYSVKDIDFKKLNTGTGVPSMTSSILYDLNIIVPEKNILEKFNTIVKQNYETIKLNSIQNQELIQLRDWLLPMLMNGQVII